MSNDIKISSSQLLFLCHETIYAYFSLFMQI